MIFWRDWIEALTGYDPDQHDGTVEGVIVIVLLSFCAVLALAARPRTATPSLKAICVSPICREPPDLAAKPTSAAQLVPTRLHNSACEGAIGKVFSNVAPDVGWRKRELLVETSVAGLALNSISVSFHHAPPRRVLNKIL
jgi:hypothetical protein